MAFTLVSSSNRHHHPQTTVTTTTKHQYYYSEFLKIQRLIIIEQQATTTAACCQEEEEDVETVVVAATTTTFAAAAAAVGAIIPVTAGDALSSPFPWVSKHYIPQNVCSSSSSSSSSNSNDDGSSSSLCAVKVDSNNNDLEEQQDELLEQQQLAHLQEALFQCHFSRKDVKQILETLNAVCRKSSSSSSSSSNASSSSSSSSLKRGMIDFLLLTLNLFGGGRGGNTDQLVGENSSNKNSGGGFLTTPVLMACILHFADCAHVQDQGLVPHRIRKTLRQRPQKDASLSKFLALPPTASSSSSAAAATALDTGLSQIHVSSSATRNNINVLFDTEDETSFSAMNFLSGSRFTTTKPYSASSTSTTTAATSATTLVKVAAIDESCNEQILQLAQGASRIHRAELLARAVLTYSASSARRRLSESSSSSRDGDGNEATASRLRDFYLSVMDDWRCLAIRVVACCYRLEGLLEQERQQQQEQHQKQRRRHEQPQNDAELRSIAAREALYIYAPLAQRLGLPPKVKAQIEGQAFKLLYRRQYRAASALYDTNQRRQEMQSISNYLLAQVSQTLRQDSFLMAHLQDLQVTARVKEPFSFWKKVVKKHVQKLSSSSSVPSTSKRRGRRHGDEQKMNDSSLLPLAAFSAKNLSLAQVNDGIALRVILKARCPNEEESEEITKTRERLLCYYVQHLIRAHWPETDESRLKDYIEKPKPNGYQSLHHTSKIISRGFEYPFEVQVRSEDMHHLAEFGVAAHWDYKLSTSSISSAPQEMNATDATVAPASKLTLSTMGKVFPATEVELVSTDHTFALSSHDECCDSDSVIVISPPSTYDNDDSDAPAASTDVASGPYVTALIHAKEILNNQVYVFVMDDQSGEDHGELASVPVGSRVVDVLTKISNGSSCSGRKIWRNARPAQLDETVLNGDVLMFVVNRHNLE
jgi:ppGpp synthetase/RelA/SpoT-type nucleotidyltranferase